MFNFIHQLLRKAGCLALGCLLAGALLLCAVLAACYGLVVTLTNR